ncbi:hypothetical protein EVAR_103085_1 [Eumeta japonica]|uniref:Mariner Mos1 transposase n=1 Tax=Eumeta variegata TaxID=151549 RepID=A0A4C1WP66_EUMVA|nr:hypothetical protein EVAR_103085_1 [Eumeta japonica]
MWTEHSTEMKVKRVAGRGAGCGERATGGEGLSALFPPQFREKVTSQYDESSGEPRRVIRKICRRMTLLKHRDDTHIWRIFFIKAFYGDKQIQHQCCVIQDKDGQKSDLPAASDKLSHRYESSAKIPFMNILCWEKRPRNKILLHHGNSLPHAARQTANYLGTLSIEILAYLPHSPEKVGRNDLAIRFSFIMATPYHMLLDKQQTIWGR